MTIAVLNYAVKQTALYNTHVNMGAKLVPFGGYEMPVSYPNGIQSDILQFGMKPGYLMFHIWVNFS